MNVESAKTPTVTKVSENQTSSSAATTGKDNSASFKQELDAVKSQDSKQTESENIQAQQQNTEPENAEAVKQNAQTNAARQLKDKQLQDEKNALFDKDEFSTISNPLDELSSKIAALNEMKNPLNMKFKSADNKIKETDLSTADCFKTMNMDKNDVTFFLNLVQNQQMSAQSTQLQNQNAINNNFTEIKTEATQSTVQVSQTLLDALNESVKTGKPFRIDFDKDIAVIMKVDKNGVLSANFIPGDAAVENYLRNNIESLKQSFNEQGLNYNELSYSKHQKQQQGQNQSQNKENEDE